MSLLKSVLDEAQSFVNKHDDDIIDRYNHRYTVISIAIFVFLVVSKQYFGEPITCWTPAQFTGSHISYANTICWTHGTYPIGDDEPYHLVDRTKVLPYYQWVPFILMFQAICFMIPNLLWHTFSKGAGIDVVLIGKNASEMDKCDKEERQKSIGRIVQHIDTSLNLRYEYQPMFQRFNVQKRLPLGRRHGNFLFIVYMLVKSIYILNLIGQLFLMNSFFGFQYHRFGLDFLSTFLSGKDFPGIYRAFPRTTFCDFEIRNLADNIHKHSVQCALPINLFNEKFFICFWFWLIILFFLTLFNFIAWFRLLFPVYRSKLIGKYLRTKNSHLDKEAFDSFVNEFCYLDGAFVLAIIRRNSSYLATAETVHNLYNSFFRSYYSRKQQEIKEKMLLESEGEDVFNVKLNIEDSSDQNGNNEYAEEKLIASERVILDKIHYRK